MKITMLEPLGVGTDVIEKLSSGLVAAGHEFKAYDSVEKDIEKLKERCADADVLIIANSPLPSCPIPPKDEYIRHGGCWDVPADTAHPPQCPHTVPNDTACEDPAGAC